MRKIKRSVSNASYTYAHAITIDTLFDRDFRPHARPRRLRACGRRGGLNQITSADDGTSVLTPTYDARGNLTSYDGRTFGYDTYNRLTSVGGTGGSMSLDYDPLGRLWETSGPSGTARYQYDGAAIIAEYNASGVMQHRWVHGRFSSSCASSAHSRLRASRGMDEPLVRYDGSGLSNRTFLHADERGSIIAHTDSSGARTQLNTYDAFGNPGASNAGLFQYTGQVWLEDAGVYYYKNRTYHAELGVFMQADPIGHSGGVNLYAYVGGDPVNLTDPWRLYAWDGDAEESECGPGEAPDAEGVCRTTDRIVVKGPQFKRYPRVIIRINVVWTINGRGGGGGGGHDGGVEGSNSGDCALPSAVPPNVSVNDNIAEARFVAATGGPVGALLWFRVTVPNGGPWDYKQLGREYEEFGNFNYGAAGRAAGIPLNLLLREAGRAQIAAGTSSEEFGDPGARWNPWGGTPPYGDDPIDQAWILDGVRYYDAGCAGTPLPMPNVTPY